jgi:tetratricopeptide (TPR) repeat protein
LLSARVYGAVNDLPRTEQTLLQLIEKDPSQLQAYGMLGQIYIAQRRLDEAVTRFEQMAQKQPRPVAPYTMIGLIRQMQGRDADAQQIYERVMSLDPRAAVAANNLAWLLAERGGNLDIALQHAQSAKQGLPDQPEVNDTLGWVYLKKALPALAIPAFQLAVEKAPANPTYHYHLGLAHLKNGDTERAKASFSQALKLDPNFPGAGEARKALAGIGLP